MCKVCSILVYKITFLRSDLHAIFLLLLFCACECQRGMKIILCISCAAETVSYKKYIYKVLCNFCIVLGKFCFVHPFWILKWWTREIVRACAVPQIRIDKGGILKRGAPAKYVGIVAGITGRTVCWCGPWLIVLSARRVVVVVVVTTSSCAQRSSATNAEA